MLNYLKAELYKIWRHPMAWVYLLVVLLLEAGFLALVGLSGSRGMTSGGMADILEEMFLFGFVLLLPPANLVFSEQYKHRTLRNEVEFGLPRPRIYLGKLIASFLLAGLTCLLLLAVWLGSSARYVSPMEFLPWLADLGHSLLLILPLWLGALGLYHALLFSFHSPVGALLLYMGYFMIIEPFGIFLGELNAGPLFHRLRQASFYVALTENAGGVPGAWLVGLGWLAGTTAVGLALFHRREIP